MRIGRVLGLTVNSCMLEDLTVSSVTWSWMRHDRCIGWGEHFLIVWASIALSYNPVAPLEIRVWASQVGHCRFSTSCSRSLVPTWGLYQIPLQPGLMRRKVCSHCMFTLVWLEYLIYVLSLSLIVAYFIFSIYMARLCILLRPSEDLVISPGVCFCDSCRCSSRGRDLLHHFEDDCTWLVLLFHLFLLISFIWDSW